MKLNRASPSILMSVLAVLSLLSRLDSSSGTLTVSATASQAVHLRVSRLRRRPERELEARILWTAATHT